MWRTVTGTPCGAAVGTNPRCTASTSSGWRFRVASLVIFASWRIFVNIRRLLDIGIAAISPEMQIRRIDLPAARIIHAALSIPFLSKYHASSIMYRYRYIKIQFECFAAINLTLQFERRCIA